MGIRSALSLPFHAAAIIPHFAYNDRKQRLPWQPRFYPTGIVMNAAPVDPVANRGKSRVQALAGRLDEVLFIHYDCGRIEEATKEPAPIFCIIAQEGDGSRLHRQPPFAAAGLLS
jgi:hypothetical protein